MNDFSEDELSVIGQALKLFIDSDESEDGWCDRCLSSDEDDAGEVAHQPSCDIAIARGALVKLRVINDDSV